ncbi:bifunctional diguanylate cyclase/phosphodiesterase [Sulfurimonas microaerophilic]|uniref:bifunctional diguanylate cyclase/phosphodiesterase n=1 Tax=Sulfurimonas microaerophilic TaxID=3058392 RepID=UPI0027153206|nr:bifunctional diguanylate cyclase/phosphodiesterase [Sulfurimonas sp. hsl 1-7]
MKLKSQQWVYFTLLISFGLLMYSLLISYKNLHRSSALLKDLSTEQVTLSYYANHLNYTVKKNQSDILQYLSLHNNLDLLNMQESQKKIQKDIKELKQLTYLKPNFSKKLEKTLITIEKRAIGYNLVQQSLVTAVNSHDTEDIKDALIGFDMITSKFSHDISILMEEVRTSLTQQITILQETNKQNSLILVFSFIFASFLIIISVYKFHSANVKISKQLQLKEKAQNGLKNAQKQLLLYNENLENEITKKTQELHKKIYTNFLSGLPNRNKLLEDGNEYNFTKMAILNIDKFQSFNDVYGEEIGNVALKQTAQWLIEHVDTKEYSLYHLGGDEFVISSLDRYINNTKFINYIQKLLNEYKNISFQYEDKSYQFIMSSGITFSGENKMLAYADMALKDAKKKNIPFSVFEDDRNLEHTHKEDMEIQKKLLYALEHNGLTSYFQPIIPIKDTTQPIKYESLVRLIDEEGKVIPPVKFLDIAKQNRVYYKVTKKVIHNTLSTIEKYQVPCSINLSLTDIKNERTIKYLYSVLDEFDLTELLTIELLETEDFDNYEEVYSFCMKIRTYGIKIALDDFGSGYSNFTHILHLPVDYIKIDSSLISNIDRDLSSQIMVETIVVLAKKLNVETIAEFVSSEDILDMVKSLGVDYVQGFHMGKPLPIEDQLSITSIA